MGRPPCGGGGVGKIDRVDGGSADAAGCSAANASVNGSVRSVACTGADGVASFSSRALTPIGRLMVACGEGSDGPSSAVVVAAAALEAASSLVCRT